MATGNITPQFQYITLEKDLFTIQIREDLYQIMMELYQEENKAIKIEFVHDIEKETYGTELDEDDVFKITNRAGMVLVVEDFYDLLKSCFDNSDQSIRISDINLLEKQSINFTIDFEIKQFKSNDVKHYQIVLPYIMQDDIQRLTKMVHSLVAANKKMKEEFENRISKLEKIEK